MSGAHALLRHCLVLVAASAVLCLFAWPLLAWGWSCVHTPTTPFTADGPLYLRTWAIASAVLCGLRLLLAGGDWLLRTVLRSY